MDKKPLTFEVIKFVIWIISLAVAVMVFYGSMDRRVTVVETELRFKVDEKALFEKLDKFKESLEKKIETEIQKVKK